jgi:hemolysin activation/secretion protein
MAPASAGKVRLRLKKVTVEGSTVYSAADLVPLYKDLIGREISASEVYDLANKIAAKYGKDGYLVARVAVVPQDVDRKGAAIRLRVVEGYIEAIEWPVSASRYLFTPCLDKIRRERPTRTKTIERCLLLANDIPGLTFSSSLRAGKDNLGGAVLVVSLTEKPFDVMVRADNRGPQGRGPWEQTTTLTENNRLGLNESTTFTYASAFDSQELQFFGGNYHQILTTDGLAFDFNATHSFGKPGLPSLTAIDFNSQSTTFDSGLTYPVIRSREQNLRLSALGFVEDASSQTVGLPFSDDRLRGVRVRANYDQVDTWFGTVGQGQVIGTYSQGIDGLGSTANGNPLASNANGRVDFSKLQLTANRSQLVGAGFSLYGALDSQWAESALLSAEQCSYGGMYFGRAYDPFALAGDRCISELAEVRYDLTIPRNPLTQTQLYAFVDHGDVYRVDTAASTPSHVAGSSAGAGVRLAWLGYLTTDIQIAKPFDDPVYKGWRGFLVLTAHY